MMRFAPINNRRPAITQQRYPTKSCRINRLGIPFWSLLLCVTFALNIAPAFQNPCGVNHSSHNVSHTDTMSLYGRKRGNANTAWRPKPLKIISAPVHVLELIRIASHKLSAIIHFLQLP